MPRILALDIGTKRIGLAITDETKTIVQPFDYTLSPDNIISGLEDLLEDYPVEIIVVGLPKNMLGNDSQQTQFSKDIGQAIFEKLNVKVEYFDERLTTKQAYLSQDKKLKIPIDSIAAKLILEQYLDKK